MLHFRAQSENQSLLLVNVLQSNAGARRRASRAGLASRPAEAPSSRHASQLPGGQRAASQLPLVPAPSLAPLNYFISNLRVRIKL